MRVVTIPSAPRQCPECGSEKLGGLSNVVESGEDSFLCHDCGVWMQISQVEGIEVAAALAVCPHCKTVGEITEGGGEEWCLGCGLNPNIRDYPTPTLSHLWKKDSDIRRLMQRGMRMWDPDSRMGEFLRNYCGPHCAYAEVCGQETGNFVTCFREEFSHNSLGEDMSRKSRKARKQREQKQRVEHKAISKNHDRALVECPSSSWFMRLLYDKSPHPEQTGDTGSGSGA